MPLLRVMTSAPLPVEIRKAFPAVACFCKVSRRFPAPAEIRLMSCAAVTVSFKATIAVPDARVPRLTSTEPSTASNILLKVTISAPPLLATVKAVPAFSLPSKVSSSAPEARLTKIKLPAVTSPIR